MVVWTVLGMMLPAACVDLTRPWERAPNSDAAFSSSGGTGGPFLTADANSAGGIGGNGGPIEGWPNTDVPPGNADGDGLRYDGSFPDRFEASNLRLDGANADAASRLDVEDAGGEPDSPLPGTDSAGTESEVSAVGTGGVGGSSLDSSDGLPTGDGSGGRVSEAGGNGVTDADQGLDSGAGDYPGTGGIAAGGTTGSGGTGSGGTGTGGTGAGGTGSGGTGTGGTGSGGTGTGGTGTGGTGTGGTGTGGTGTGGSACASYPGRDAGTGVTEGLVAYYRCESAAGASGTGLEDYSGAGHDATLHTGAGGTTGYSFVTGKVFNALHLVAAQQGYVTLPAGLLENACEATIATWVLVSSSESWQKIFDFGRDSTAYMFLVPKNGDTGKLRFAISVGGRAGEQIIDGADALPTGSWQHVAVVLGLGGGVLYLNGQKVVANPALTLRPADLGNPPNLYIGRSQFEVDPYFDGNIDSFRVFDRALSDDEIAAVYQYNGT
jgi:hypothetical protein